MPASPSPHSGAQAARRQVADRLRELRQDAGLTARELSARAGWHESKTSRIEAAKQAVADADIAAWCRVCGAQDQAADLIAASRTAEGAYVHWRRLVRAGMRRDQERRLAAHERTRLMRIYSSSVVPGTLQTPAYARALLSASADFHRTSGRDLEEAVAARTARGRLLREGGHRYAVLLEEAVLGYRVGGEQAMAEQLHRILAAMRLPSVSLGVLPAAAPRTGMWPVETFSVFDGERVLVEQLTAQVTVTAPSEVAAYLRAWGRLAEAAVYGDAARELILRAAEPLAE